jgi:hypothetical protein
VPDISLTVTVSSGERRFYAVRHTLTLCVVGHT